MADAEDPKNKPPRIRGRGAAKLAPPTARASGTVRASNEELEVLNEALRDAGIPVTLAAAEVRVPDPPETAETHDGCLPKIPSIYRDGYAEIMARHPLQILLEAIQDGGNRRGWSDNNGQTPPHYYARTQRGAGACIVSVQPATGGFLTDDVLRNLWEKVQALDDLTSDVFLYCLARLTPNGMGLNPVAVTADAILDARGVQPIRKRGEPANWQHGHRSEDRMLVGRALAQLRDVWLELQNINPAPLAKGRVSPISVRSVALVMTDIAERPGPDGQPIFLGAMVTAGSWARAYSESGLPYQTTLLAQKALAYHPNKEQVEKRLTKYLPFQFRFNAKHETPSLRRSVRELLDSAGVRPNELNPERTRKRLEEGLDRLKCDGVIADWHYAEDNTSLPARGWVPRWLEWRIVLTPSLEVEAFHETRRQEAKRYRELAATKANGMAHAAGAKQPRLLR